MTRKNGKSGLSEKQRKGVKKIIRMNMELKHKVIEIQDDVTSNPSPTGGAVPQIFLGCTNISAGAAANQRIGNEIFMHGVWVRLFIKNLDVQNSVRVIVTFQPSAADFGPAVPLSAFDYPKPLEPSKGVKVLMDKLVPLDSVGGRDMAIVDKFLKLGNRICHYNGNAETDNAKGTVAIKIFTKSTKDTGGAEVSGICQLAYRDA